VVLKLIPPLSRMSIIALPITLVVPFTYQRYLIIELPAIIGMITAGIFANILLVFLITYLVSKAVRLSYEDAAPTAIIAGSNHNDEVAVFPPVSGG
jgi:ACR3 family arsenite transporter